MSLAILRTSAGGDFCLMMKALLPENTQARVRFTLETELGLSVSIRCGISPRGPTCFGVYRGPHGPSLCRRSREADSRSASEMLRKLKLTGVDSPGIVASVADMLARLDISILSIESHVENAAFSNQVQPPPPRTHIHHTTTTTTAAHSIPGAGDLERAKFGTAKCGTTRCVKLFHILGVIVTALGIHISPCDHAVCSPGIIRKPPGNNSNQPIGNTNHHSQSMLEPQSGNVVPKSPRREVVRSSAGTSVVYPPFFGVVRVAYPNV